MPNFELRDYQENDVAELYEAIEESRAHVSRWMPWLTPDYSIKETEEWVNLVLTSREKGDSFEFLITDSSDGSLVGLCGLNLLNKENLFCNIGYWVRHSRLGEGAAVAGLRLLRNYAFSETELRRLEIVIAEGNTYSRAVAETSGATYEGLLRKRLKIRETSHDAHMFAFIRD